MEQKVVIEPELLEQVAKVLEVPVEAIKNFNKETAIVKIQNNYGGANSGSGIIGNNFNYHYCTFNPIDKIVELYEALVKSEREKIELMQKKRLP